MPSRPPNMKLYEIGDGKDFKEDWNARAKMFGPDHVAAFGPESAAMFAEYHAYTVAQRLIAMLQLSSRDRVLDVGCGPGRISFYLARHVQSIVGVDVSDEMLRCARRRCRGLANVRWILNNGKNLAELADRSFDVAFSYACFIHLPGDVQDAYIKEILRVLRPGGAALCHVRYGQKHKIIIRTFTGANLDAARLKRIAEAPRVASAKLIPITRGDDFVKHLNHRRWLWFKKKA